MRAYRLVRIDFPDTTFATYRYDAAGRRIGKDVNGAVTRYVYDAADILLEYDGANVLQARYTHGPGVDELLVMARDTNGDGAFGAGERFVYHRDGLGSVVQLTDAAGSVARAYGYDAYGRIVDETGSVANPYTYTGRERDGESGLYFYRARYYDPATGRFLSEDPIGFGAGDASLFRYVFNNPIHATDPTGEVAPLAACAVGALLGGVAGGIRQILAPAGNALIDKPFLGGDGLDFLNPVEDAFNDVKENLTDRLTRTNGNRDSSGCGEPNSAGSPSNNEPTGFPNMTEGQIAALKKVGKGVLLGAAGGCLSGLVFGVGGFGVVAAPFTGFVASAIF